jgi:hypothetical protein
MCGESLKDKVVSLLFICSRIKKGEGQREEKMSKLKIFFLAEAPPKLLIESLRGNPGLTRAQELLEANPGLTRAMETRLWRILVSG